MRDKTTQSGNTKVEYPIGSWFSSNAGNGNTSYSIAEELSLSPWDYAAGALIVEEAGGIVTNIDGKALVYDRKSSILVRNKVARPHLR